MCDFFLHCFYWHKGYGYYYHNGTSMTGTWKQMILIIIINMCLCISHHSKILSQYVTSLHKYEPVPIFHLTHVLIYNIIKIKINKIKDKQ